MRGPWDWGDPKTGEKGKVRGCLGGGLGGIRECLGDLGWVRGCFRVVRGYLGGFGWVRGCLGGPWGVFWGDQRVFGGCLGGPGGVLGEFRVSPNPFWGYPPCFMACFSCRAGWIFSICRVRNSIFRLKNSRASSADWNGEKRGKLGKTGENGRKTGWEIGWA